MNYVCYCHIILKISFRSVFSLRIWSYAIQLMTIKCIKYSTVVSDCPNFMFLFEKYWVVLQGGNKCFHIGMCCRKIRNFWCLLPGSLEFFLAGTLFYVTTLFTLHAGHFTWMQATQSSPLFHLSWGGAHLLQYIAVYIWFLHTIFKAGAGNVVLMPADKRII